MALFGKESNKKGDKDMDNATTRKKQEDKKLAYSFPPFDDAPSAVQQEKVDTFPSTDSGEYKAFSRIREEGSTAIHIDIQMKGEHFFLMNCHLIRGVEFRGNTQFEILYDQDRFIFEGSNLLQIKPFLQQQRLLNLQEFDPTKHSGQTIDSGAAIITAIQWIRLDDKIEEALQELGQ
jgi:hypothetical protein